MNLQKLAAWTSFGVKPHIWILIALAALIGLYLLYLSRRDKRAADAKTEAVRVLTEEKLAAIPDDQLIAGVIRNLHAKLDSRRPDPYRDIPLLSPGRCAVYSVWVVEHEWRAGGFDAMFRGTTAKFVPLAIDGWRLMGVDACADLLEQIAALPAAERGEQREAFERMLAETDTAALCIAYIRDNVAEFTD